MLWRPPPSALSEETLGQEPATSDEPQSQPVYVNGQTGSDDNDGTKDKPVKTFAKAKELLDSNGGAFAYVTGALMPSGQETWDFGGKTLLREPGYTGELVRVEKERASSSPTSPSTATPSRGQEARAATSRAAAALSWAFTRVASP